ncbi:MAG: HD-GYP domain-containing protein [Castellaniella sp.]|nr:HD-GYP domain-containing protein [Castellaniella sp.]
MLKRVSVSQLCVGMYVQELGGSFLDHSFWRSHFLISSESKLRRLRKSSLEWVLIDTARGLDVQDAAQAALGAAAAGAAVSTAGAPVAGDGVTAQAREAQAFEDAHDIIDGSRAQIMQLFSDAKIGNKTDLSKAQGLIQDMADSIEGHPDALTSLARIKRADQYTYMHSVAVAALMTSLARTMGLSDDQVRLAGMAGLLHDIGKVHIPDAVLNKPGRLTPAEYELVQSHPVSGAAMLRADAEVPPEVVDVCLHHHEKMDGQGYPDRLAGNQISLMARMGAVCDVYDAVTSNRPYKKGWDPAFALFKMMSWEGHFDPEILQAFIRTVGRYPVGSIISLTDSELGLAVAQNRDTPELPVVKVFYSIRWSHAIPERRVDLAEPDCPSRVLPVRFPVDWAQSGLPVPPIVG